MLAALQPQIGADTEILLVDSSGFDAAEALQRSQPWVRVIGLPNRVAPGAARNLGSREARGSRLAFLDADAVPGAAWLAHTCAPRSKSTVNPISDD